MDSRLLENARIFLEASCRATAGDSVLIVVASGDMMERAPAVVAAGLALGLVPSVMDVRPFIDSPLYKTDYVLQPLKSAMESADIVISSTDDVFVTRRADYARYMGDSDAHDKSLTAQRRWVYLQCGGMENWNITEEQVVAMRERTLWLLKLLRSAKQGRITSRLGTDFVFGLGPAASCTPILGIAPLYAEVAVVPDPWTTSGVFVVDGPTQGGVRSADELDHAPLRVTVEAGHAVSIAGDAVQRERLKQFIASGDPTADSVDEVGILTTTFAENDLYYWSDGTHHHDRVHVALGNNSRRDTVVHGPRHMDGEVCNPTISIDGLVIIRDGVFLDEARRQTM